MRTVLFAHDMEPITVVELEPWQVKFLQERGRVYFAVMRPVATVACVVETPERLSPSMMQCCVTAERFIRNGVEHLFLFTADEEQALLLKSAFLPGQWGAVREHERQAWANGFMGALFRAGKESQ